MTNISRALAGVGLSAMLTACPTFKPLEWGIPAVPPGLVVREPDLCLTAWGQSQDGGNLRDATAETKRIVQGDGFKAHLSAITRVDENGGGPPISGPDLLRVYAGQISPVLYEPDSSGKNETASTGLSTPNGSAPYATTQVTINTVEEWKSGPDDAAIISRACLINTIAHEWTHAIADSNNRQRVTDNGHGHSEYSLVSYTVGAVAQCSYIEDALKDRPGALPPGFFERCVSEVGTRDFCGARVCQADWLPRLREHAAANRALTSDACR